MIVGNIRGHLCGALVAGLAVSWGSGVHAQSITLVELRDTLTVDWRRLTSSPGQLPQLEVLARMGDESNLVWFQVAGAVPTPNGNWIVGQKRAPFLTSTDGRRELRRAGRQGRGPGEYRRLDWLGRDARGQIVAVSFMDQKISRYDTTLDLLSERTLTPSAFLREGIQAPGAVVGFTRSNGLLVVSKVATGVQLPEGVTRLEGRVVEINDEGTPLRTWRSIRLNEVAGIKRGDATVFDTAPPLQKRTIVRLIGDRVFVGDTESGIVEGSDVDSDVVLRIRFPSADRSPSDNEIARAIQPRLEAASEGFRARLESNLKSIVSPGPPPLLYDFIGVPDGVYWFWLDPVVRPELGHVIIEVNVTNLTARAFVGEADFTPIGADATRIWGVAKDELGVERLLSFRRPSE